jgi:hypothetical protein
MALRLRLCINMVRRRGLTIVAILAGVLILTQCRPPTPIAATVDISSAAVSAADPRVLKELTAAFDRAETAVNSGNVDALMPFYADTYNYHGLKRPDVRRIWEEVFTHYRAVSSRHVFSELTVQQAGGARKISVTCTGGLYGTDRHTGKPVTIDSWVSEIHHLVYEQGAWRFLGNASGSSLTAPAGSAPHHPLF